MKRIVAIAAAALCVMAAGEVSAQAGREEGASVAVGYSDLDLSTTGGRTTLERRVDAAVERVCPRGDQRRLELRRYEAACRAQAEASARVQLAAILSHTQLARASVLVSAGAR